MMLRRKLSEWFKLWFGPEWKLIPFQPILYFFMFSATIRTVVNNTIEAMHFEVLGTSPELYLFWVYCGIYGPIVAMISYYMITKMGGKFSFLGMWFMLSANISQFTNLLSVHLISVLYVTHGQVTETRFYNRYIIASALTFILYLILRDIVAISYTQILARKIRRDKTIEQ